MVFWNPLINLMHEAYSNNTSPQFDLPHVHNQHIGECNVQCNHSLGFKLCPVDSQACTKTTALPRTCWWSGKCAPIFSPQTQTGITVVYSSKSHHSTHTPPPPAPVVWRSLTVKTLVCSPVEWMNERRREARAMRGCRQPQKLFLLLTRWPCQVYGWLQRGDPDNSQGTTG